VRCRLQFPRLDLTLDYHPRRQFVPFHDRRERFACMVTHRRAGKTVACIQDLQRGALDCPRFAYMSPFLKQSKAVAWDYLCAAMAPLREHGATVHESELRVDYPGGGQVQLYGADNPDAMRGRLAALWPEHLATSMEMTSANFFRHSLARYRPMARH
jgi:phage terminase large subunit